MTASASCVAHHSPAMRTLSEAIRKPFRTVVTRSDSFLAVMKCRATARGESVPHKMSMTDLDCAVTTNNALLATRKGLGERPLGQPPYLMPKG